MKFNTQMNAKVFLVPFVAALAILFIGMTSAYSTDFPIQNVEFNGVELHGFNSVDNIAGFTGENVPVRVTFRANTDSEDVKIRVEIYSGRDDVIETTGRFNVVDGNTYTKLLSLELPDDLKDITKDLTLVVRVYDANHDTNDEEQEYVVKMQRESYEFDVLSIDYEPSVSAGDIVPVSVVVENTGFQDLEDGYVVVSIDELGVSKRGYFGDLAPTEDCYIYEDYYNDRLSVDCDDNSVDSTQKTVYVKIPESSDAGVYTLNVRVYNGDASVRAEGLIKVDGSASGAVIAAVKNQDLKAGETKTYDLIIVNPTDSVRVYNIQAVSGTALQVSVPSVVTVGPESSDTVPVQVTATSGADVGAYTFSVDVNGEQVVFGANVTSGRAGTSSSIVALTVVLVIVFVVLLIVLIVLLTRKEKPSEEVETSYY